MRVRSFPRQCSLFGLEKSINDEGVLLRCSPTAGTRGRATCHRGSAVDSGANGVRKKQMAAVWDPFGIDSAMAGAQARAVGTCAQLTFTRPVNRDPCKQRRFDSEHWRCK